MVEITPSSFPLVYWARTTPTSPLPLVSQLLAIIEDNEIYSQTIWPSDFAKNTGTTQRDLCQEFAKRLFTNLPPYNEYVNNSAGLEHYTVSVLMKIRHFRESYEKAVLWLKVPGLDEQAKENKVRVICPFYSRLTPLVSKYVESHSHLLAISSRGLGNRSSHPTASPSTQLLPYDPESSPYNMDEHVTKIVSEPTRPETGVEAARLDRSNKIAEPLAIVHSPQSSHSKSIMSIEFLAPLHSRHRTPGRETEIASPRMEYNALLNENSVQTDTSGHLDRRVKKNTPLLYVRQSEVSNNENSQASEGRDEMNIDSTEELKEPPIAMTSVKFTDTMIPLPMQPRTVGHKLTYPTPDFFNTTPEFFKRKISSNAIPISQRKSNSTLVKREPKLDVSVGKSRKTIMKDLVDTQAKEARINHLNGLRSKLKAKKADFNKRWLEGEEDDELLLAWTGYQSRQQTLLPQNDQRDDLTIKINEEMETKLSWVFKSDNAQGQNFETQKTCRVWSKDEDEEERSNLVKTSPENNQIKDDYNEKVIELMTNAKPIESIQKDVQGENRSSLWEKANNLFQERRRSL